MFAEIEQRLKSTATTLKSVEGAVEFAAIDGVPPLEKQPAAFVFPIAETYSQNRLVTGIVRQQATIRIGVALAVGKPNDRRGEKSALSLEGVKNDVRAALLGWSPSSEDDPLTLVRGETLGLIKGVAWWLYEFASANTVQG